MPTQEYGMMVNAEILSRTADEIESLLLKLRKETSQVSGNKWSKKFGNELGRIEGLLGAALEIADEVKTRLEGLLEALIKMSQDEINRVFDTMTDDLKTVADS